VLSTRILLVLGDSAHNNPPSIEKMFVTRVVTHVVDDTVLVWIEAELTI